MSDEPKRGRVTALKRPDPKPDPECVELAELTLKQAQSGAICELVVITGSPDGSTEGARTGIRNVSAILGELRLVGDDLSEAARSDD